MSEKIHILVVDDEPDLLEVLSDDIMSLGYKVTTAENGKVALGYMQQVKDGSIWFDAVLSDINMPQMSGLAMLEKVRELQLETPFVFLSGHGDKEKAIQAMRFGALDFLEKPYQRDNLLQIVKKAAELGVAIHEIEFEIQSLISKSKLSPEDTAKMVQVQRTLLKIKKLNDVYFKK